MDKFYWEPSRDDIVAIVHQLYTDDGLGVADVAALVDQFSNQGLDFFGHLRSSLYDSQIREWIRSVVGGDLAAEGANMSEVSRRLLTGDGVPAFEPVTATLDALLAEGRRLIAEQDAVNANSLAEEYLKGLKQSKARGKGAPGLGLGGGGGSWGNSWGGAGDEL